MCDAESLWLRREVSVRLRVALDGFGVAFGVGSARHGVKLATETSD